MMLSLLLAAAAPQTAVDAERAFAAAARTHGQWTAFRTFADAGAVMFVPQPVNAQAWLKDRRDPPRSVRWQVANSFRSCDRDTAANTGPWQRPDKSVGYFSTIWDRGEDGGWRWTVDGGDMLRRPRPVPARARVVTASCRGTPTTVAAVRYRDGQTGEGQSGDGTLAWRWHVAPDGGRSFDVWLWTGQTMRRVIANRVAASPA